MKNLTRQLLYKGDNVARANVMWNIAGSFVYAFASMVLSFLVIRMAGEEKGGIFSFGYSTLGQQLFLVAYFGIRPFQITDGKGEYSFREYREHRNISDREDHCFPQRDRRLYSGKMYDPASSCDL